MGLFNHRDPADVPAPALVVPAVVEGTPIEFPIWPTGLARYADGILEVTTGEGLRVATRDIVSLEVKPARAGRLTLKVAYHAGLSTNTCSYWVELPSEIPLHQLVNALTPPPVAA